MTSKERKKREEVGEEGQDLTDNRSKNLGEKLKALHCTINKKVLQLLDYDSISSLWYLSSVHSSIQKVPVEGERCELLLETNAMALTAHPFFHLVVHTYTGPFLTSPFHAVMTKEQERRDDGSVPKSHTYRRSSVEPLLHNFQLYFRAGRAVKEQRRRKEGEGRPDANFGFFSGAATTLTRVANSDEQFLKGSDRSSPKLHSQVSLSVKPRGLLLLLSPTLQPPHTSFFRAARPNSLSQGRSGADGGDRQARRGPDGKGVAKTKRHF